MKSPIRFNRRALLWLSLATVTTSLAPIGDASAQTPIDREALIKALTVKVASRNGEMASDQETGEIAAVARRIVSKAPDDGLNTIEQFILNKVLIPFPFDQYVLTPEAQDALVLVADMAIRFDVKAILVVGYSDTSLSFGVADALSQRRAAATADSLVGLGVPASLLSIEGRGKTDLSVPTGDNVHEPLNRFAVLDITL